MQVSQGGGGPVGRERLKGAEGRWVYKKLIKEAGGPSGGQPTRGQSRVPSGRIRGGCPAPRESGRPGAAQHAPRSCPARAAELFGRFHFGGRSVWEDLFNGKFGFRLASPALA